MKSLASLSAPKTAFERLPEEWAAHMAELGEPAYRGKQVFRWIWHRGVTDPAAMTDLSLGLRDKLLAATHTLEEMRTFIGADSLAFLSVEGIYRAMGHDKRDPVRPQFTDHCFTGDYPTALTDQTDDAGSPRQLSLLAEAG